TFDRQRSIRISRFLVRKSCSIGPPPQGMAGGDRRIGCGSPTGDELSASLLLSDGRLVGSVSCNHVAEAGHPTHHPSARRAPQGARNPSFIHSVSSPPTDSPRGARTVKGGRPCRPKTSYGWRPCSS